MEWVLLVSGTIVLEPSASPAVKTRSARFLVSSLKNHRQQIINKVPNGLDLKSRRQLNLRGFLDKPREVSQRVLLEQFCLLAVVEKLDLLVIEALDALEVEGRLGDPLPPDQRLVLPHFDEALFYEALLRVARLEPAHFAEICGREFHKFQRIVVDVKLGREDVGEIVQEHALLPLAFIVDLKLAVDVDSEDFADAD